MVQAYSISQSSLSMNRAFYKLSHISKWSNIITMSAVFLMSYNMYSMDILSKADYILLLLLLLAPMEFYTVSW